jgi:hypothetical protein
MLLNIFTFASCFCVPSKNTIYIILHICGFYFGFVCVFRDLRTSLDKRIPRYTLVFSPSEGGTRNRTINDFFLVQVVMF